MKKYILTIMLFSLGFAGYAQVGIGTATPTTTLHVVESGSFSSTTGITIPVVTEDMTTTTTDGTEPSQLVYSTNASSTGYYYWNGTAWTALVPGIEKNYTTVSSGGSYTVSSTDDILYYDGSGMATWTLPSNVPVGKTYYIINREPANTDSIFFTNTIVTTALNFVGATQGGILIHTGSGNYAVISGY